MLYMTVELAGISSCQPRTTNWQSCFGWIVLLRSNLHKKKKEMEQHSPLVSQCSSSESARQTLSPQNIHSFPEKTGCLRTVHRLWCCECLPLGSKFLSGLFIDLMLMYFQVVCSVLLELSDAHMPCWSMHMQMVSTSQWRSERTALRTNFPCVLLLVAAVLKDACFNEQETEAVLLGRKKLFRAVEIKS